MITAVVTAPIPEGFTDEKYADQGNLSKFIIPDYTRWDARAIWESPTRSINVSLFVKNLLDEIAVQQWSPSQASFGGAAPKGSLTDERRFGLQVNYQLGPGGRIFGR